MRKFYKLTPALIFLSGCITAANAQDLATIAGQKPFTVAGSLDLRGIFYHAQGIPARRPPFSYLLSGSPVFSLYGISIPVSFSISEQQRDFRQPFNQFGLSPTYKWIAVHGGYRNIEFSPYTLAGYTMLGGGIELTPGRFRFGAMYGRLNKATEIDTTTGALQPYSFSRKGYALKAGYGSDEKFIELSFLSAHDDSTSVQKSIPDSVKTITPAANAVASIRGAWNMARKFYFEADAGISVYTYNTGSTIGNPADLQKISKAFKSIVPVNASSQANLAYSAGITYKAANYSLKLTYRYVDPEFQSMGAYFFNNDFRNITLSPEFSVANRTVRFNGSIGLQKDNLRKQKEQTTTRVIGSANVSWDITSRLGIDANYVNYSTKAAPQVVLVNNKYLLAQTSHNLSATPRYIVTNDRHTHVVLLSYNYSTLVDFNPDTKELNHIRTGVGFLNYNLNFNKTGWSVSAGLNRSINKYYSGKALIYGFSLGGSKNFLQNRLQLATTNSFSIVKQMGSAIVINAGLTGAYNLAAQHRFSARWNLLANRPETIVIDPRFTENTAELGYTWTF
ncbi:MAG: hypothetical protein ABW019_03710 [Chitinophagaceae bacterium]